MRLGCWCAGWRTGQSEGPSSRYQEVALPGLMFILVTKPKDDGHSLHIFPAIAVTCLVAESLYQGPLVLYQRP